MKKVYSLLLALLLCSEMINAQGIYQFWGMTELGGSDNIGAIFNASSSGNNFNKRYQFEYKNPGTSPGYSEPAEYNGKFYGITSQGGLNDAGVIFEWNPATNAYTKKIDFSETNGKSPYGSLTLNNGKFYGMTNAGGNSNDGVIFEWNPATNIYIKKFDFNASAGKEPYGSLTICEDKFYGMTYSGGINNAGVIFQWDPVTNIYTKKIDFSFINGKNPYGDLTYNGGKLYGMTNAGGINGSGVIFEWDPVSNQYVKKIDLSATIGSRPQGSLIFNGVKFYGMTSEGGSNNVGVIFEWDPVPNLYTKRIDLNDTDGSQPLGNLIEKNGKFYGMTNSGGINSGYGVIFEWNPVTNVYTKKIDLSYENGTWPMGSLVRGGAGKFYGMTSHGGNEDAGVIFEWDPANNIYTKKIGLKDFSDGRYPRGNLTLSYGKYYGITSTGGSYNGGVIFEFDPATNVYTKKVDLNGANGSFPTNSLIAIDGKLYGIASDGGTNNAGVIFVWDPASNVFTKKIDLNDSDGSHPLGKLTFSEGMFYGMTNTGGSDNRGVIFEWNPVSNIYTKKIDLTTAGGFYPFGSLMLYNGKFYGMTSDGGINNAGVIFEWDPASNVYTKKIDLSSDGGSRPDGNLTFNGGKFYGLTSEGGSNNAGVIFEWDPASNVYTKRIDMNPADGSMPKGSLTLNNGKFYGMTSEGGSNNMGVIFEWDPVTNLYTKKEDFDGINGNSSISGNDLSLLPAAVAKGFAGSCVSFPDVVIDNTNNNRWVAITDDQGDAVAEIKANGNNLGIVSSVMYINDGGIREDGYNKLYLNRNLTLTPEVQPTSAVDIRLYIKGSEYLALKNAVNSNGQPSGINSIDDVGIYKNSEGCSTAVGLVANPVVTIAGNWEADYVLSASVPSFSSFYFANKSQGGSLPITRLEFNGRLVNNNGEISWKTSDEFNTRTFNLERSTDGRIFSSITNIDAVNQPGVHQYAYTDKNINLLGVSLVYYRLKQNDQDGRFTYSGVVALSMKNSNFVLLYPNPASDNVNLTISINKPEQVQLKIVDNAGRVLKQQQWNLLPGSSSIPIDVSMLAKGIYFLELKGETTNEHKQFIKQ
jgi:uncharacterized repeat protein (TIGR03803 family)